VDFEDANPDTDMKKIEKTDPGPIAHMIVGSWIKGILNRKNTTKETNCGKGHEIDGGKGLEVVGAGSPVVNGVYTEVCTTADEPKR